MSLRIGLKVGVALVVGLLLANGAAAQTPPPPPVTAQFVYTTYNVNESLGTVDIQVGLSAPAPNTILVSYTTSDGTAVAGTDYTTTSGTLTFNTGDVVQSFTVPILDSSQVYTMRTVNLSLTAVQNASLGTPSQAALQIWDDDGGQVIYVDASNGGPSPANPSATGTAVTVSLTASVPNPPQVDPGDILVGPTWLQPGNTTAWEIDVAYSASDPTSFGSAGSGTYNATVNQPSQSVADATLTFIPNAAGYWQVTARPYVSYYDSTTQQTWMGQGVTVVLIVAFLAAAPPPFTVESSPNSTIGLNNNFTQQAGNLEVLVGWSARFSVPGAGPVQWQVQPGGGGAWVNWGVGGTNAPANPLVVGPFLAPTGTWNVRYLNAANVPSASRVLVLGDIDRTNWVFKFTNPDEPYTLDPKNKFNVLPPTFSPITMKGMVPSAPGAPTLTKFRCGIIQSINGTMTSQLNWVPPLSWVGTRKAGDSTRFEAGWKSQNISPPLCDSFQADGMFGTVRNVPLGASYDADDRPKTEADLLCRKPQTLP